MIIFIVKAIIALFFPSRITLREQSQTSNKAGNEIKQKLLYRRKSSIDLLSLYQ